MSEEELPIYDRGIAHGTSDIRTDTMHFIYRGEKFEFPTMVVFPYVRFNGYFYEAQIDDLRKLEAEAAAGT